MRIQRHGQLECMLLVKNESVICREADLFTFDSQWLSMMSPGKRNGEDLDDF